MPLSPDTDLLIEELKRIYLQYCVWLDAVKATIPSLKIEFYGWKKKLSKTNCDHL